MIDLSRARILRAAILGALTLPLTACGVKGDLDPPPAAATQVRAEQTADAQATERESKIFTEQSAIRRTPSYSILPKIPPEAWQKNREVQSTRRPKPRSKPGPDEPFFLDPIL